MGFLAFLVRFMVKYPYLFLGILTLLIVVSNTN